MLDFSLIGDDQSSSARGVGRISVGGIDYEEFVAAQAAGVIEPHLDYYGKFRWSNELIQRKLALLSQLDNRQFNSLEAILRHAHTAECGLVASGD